MRSTQRKSRGFAKNMELDEIFKIRRLESSRQHLDKSVEDAGTQSWLRNAVLTPEAAGFSANRKWLYVYSLFRFYPIAQSLNSGIG